jgi:predicted O-methyltransferase YrrM
MTNDSLPNWFANDGATNFQNILPPEFSGKPARFLQIGSYAGDASFWIYENLLKDSASVLVDVDTWEGSDEIVHKQLNWKTVENVYDIKTAQARLDRKILKLKTTSDAFFKNNREFYDFIYIDGDHTAYGVIKDAVNAFECLNPRGIIGFDDYDWRGGTGAADRPRMAIDAFLEIYKGKIEILLKGYQCWIRKIG